MIKCPKCGNKIYPDKSMLFDEFTFNIEYCDVCNTQFVFNNDNVVLFTSAREPTAVTVDVIIINSDKEVLLVTRKFSPYAGMLAFPGGFVNPNETCEDAAVREIHEETNLRLDIAKLKLLTVLSNPGRDQRGRVISCVYEYTESIDIEPVAGDDAKNAKFYNISTIKSMAFDHMNVLRCIHAPD